MQAWTCAHTGTHTKAHLQHRHNVHTCTHMDAHICSLTTYRHAHTHYIYAHRLSTQIQTSATFTIYGHAHMYMHTHDTHAHSIQTLLYVFTTVLGTLTAIFKHNYTAVLAATYKWGRWAALVIVYKKYTYQCWLQLQLNVIPMTSIRDRATQPHSHLHSPLLCDIHNHPRIYSLLTPNHHRPPAFRINLQAIIRYKETC